MEYYLTLQRNCTDLHHSLVGLEHALSERSHFEKEQNCMEATLYRNVGTRGQENSIEGNMDKV